MRKLMFAIALLLCAIPGVAQFTTVTGTVTDPNGLAYANGTISATLVISGSPIFTASNLPYAPPTQPSGLNGAGTFTLQLADNTALTPSGSKWNFNVCSSAGTVNPAFGKGPVCFTLSAPITISGSSQDISSTLSAAAPALTASFGGTGSVNNFTSGNLSPLFTTSVATPTTTPALSFTLSNAPANSVFANLTGSSALPSFTTTQGTDSKVLTAGTVSGTGVSLCTDALGGATTSGCPAGGGTITGSGATNSIPVFTSSTALGNSSITDNGSIITAAEILNVGTTTSLGAAINGIANPTTCIGSETTFNAISPDCRADSGQMQGPAGATGIEVGVWGTAPGANGLTGNTALIAGVYGTGSGPASGGSANYEAGIAGFASTNSTTGTVSHLSGVVGIAQQNPAQTLTDAQGGDFQIQEKGSGSIPLSAGVHVRSPSITSTGTLTNNIGVLVEDQTVAGSGTNTTPQGFVERGTAPNSLAGPLTDSFSGNSLTLSGLTGLPGSGKFCLDITSLGVVSVTTADCGSGSGTITGVTAGTGLSGGGSSGSVTVNLAVPVTVPNGGTNNTAAPSTGQVLVANSATKYGPTSAFIDNSQSGGNGVQENGPVQVNGGSLQIYTSLLPTTGFGCGSNAFGLGVDTSANDSTSTLQWCNATGNFFAAPKASPAFTGVPTAPTAPAGTSTTQIATTAFVGSAIGGGAVTYTGNTTASLSDNKKVVVLNCASACTYSLPATQPSSTFAVSIISEGAGATTIGVSGGVATIWGNTSFSYTLVNGELFSVHADSTSANNYIVNPPINIASSILTLSTSSAFNSNGTISLGSNLGSGFPASGIPVATGGSGATSNNPFNGAAGPQDIGAGMLCVDAGASGTAYTCSTASNPAGTGGAIGDPVIQFVPNTTNTGAATLTLNGGSSFPIKKCGGQTALAAGDLVAKQSYLLTIHNNASAQTFNAQSVTIECASVGSTSISSLVAATTSNAPANGNNPQTWNWAQTTNSQSAMTFGETTAASGTSDNEVTISTASTSTAVPLNISQGAITGTTGPTAFSLNATYNNGSLVQFMQTYNLTNTLSNGGSGFFKCLGGNAASTLECSMDIGGDLQLNGVIYQATNSGNQVLCGGSSATCIVSSNSSLGGAFIQGADDSSNGSSVVAGSAVLRAGLLNNAAPNAAALAGTVQVVAGAVKSGTIGAVSNVECQTSTSIAINDCPAGSLIVSGIARQSGAGGVSYAAEGVASVNLDNTATVGHTVCMSLTTAGQGHDNGTIPCSGIATIGIVVAVAGQPKEPTGAGGTFAPTTLSTSLPLVRLQITPGSVPIGGTAVVTGRTTAIGSTTLLASAASNALYRITADVDCTASSASATVSLTIGWTDTSSTAQTQTTSNAVCTTLGSASFQSLVTAIQVKASTNITYSTTIANTPTYDLRVAGEQMTGN